MKKGKTCGFKRGNEVRVKEIIQHPSARGNPCPATTESRKCIVQRKRCQKEGKGKKKIGRKKGKNPTKMKARRQDRKAKGEQPEDKTENRGKATTKHSRRKGKPQTKNRTWHQLTLHINGPP